MILYLHCHHFSHCHHRYTKLVDLDERHVRLPPVCLEQVLSLELVALTGILMIMVVSERRMTYGGR